MKVSASILSVVSIAVVMLSAEAARAACGLVEVAKGEVKIQTGTGAATAAAVGAKICSGDTITAGKDSRAKLKMEDGNELNISPDSKIVLETYQYNPAENKKKVLLNVLSGKVRAATKQENMYNDKARDGADNSFQVRTKSAVAGVRGTDFLTGYDPKTNKSEVVTFKGKVEFGRAGANGAIVGAVQVSAGQKTEMMPGQPPAPPKVIPPKELQQMNTETKSETPTAAAGSGSGSGSGKQAANGSDKDSDKDSGKDSGAKREPAAAAPTASAPAGAPALGGSMLTADETKGATTVAAPDVKKIPSAILVPIATTPAVVPTPIQQVTDAIRNQNQFTKLKINVTVKP